MRLGLNAAAILLALAASGARAGPADDVAAFEKAVGAADGKQVAAIYARVHAAWTAAGGTHRSPALDAFNASFALATGEPDTAVALATAGLVASDAATRPHLLLIRAQAHEARREDELALADYRAAAIDSTSETGRVAAIGAARLTPDPHAAAALLAPLTQAAAPGDRWEAELMLARALGLLGDAAGATVQRSAAWRDAPFARSPRVAIARVAGDMAIAALATGDRTHGTALLPLAPNRLWLDAEMLAPCSGTLRPDDRVTVEVIGENGVRRVTAVAATRAEAAAPLVAALRAAEFVSDASPAFATVACTAGPTRPTPPIRALDAAATWWAEAMAYQPPEVVTSTAPDETLAGIAAEIRRIETAEGPNSRKLLPLLASQSAAYLQQINRNPAYGERALEANRRILELLRSVGAPPAVVQSYALRIEGMEQMIQHPGQQTATSETLRKTAIAFAGGGDLGWAAASLARLRGNGGDDPAAKLHDIMLLEPLIDQAHPADGDPRLKLFAGAALPELRKAGRTVELARIVKRAKLDPRSCASAEVAPSPANPAEGITPDDYPSDAVRWEIEGSTMVQIDVAADGTASNFRLLASTPPGVFDAVTTEKIGKLRFNPAERGGRPYACTGYTTHVRWRLPGDDADEDASAEPGS